MRMQKSFIAVTYLASVLLGNVCLLQLTQAIAVPDSANSPVLSRMDASDCPFVKMTALNTKTAPPQNSCSTGHCVTTPSPEISLFAPGVKVDTAAPLVVALSPEYPLLPSSDGFLPQSPAERPPPLVAGVATVVLRL